MSSLTDRPRTPSGRTLRILPTALTELHNHARRGHPHEVAGILAGSRSENTVTQAVVMEDETLDDPARRFSVNGLALVRAEQSLEAEGLEVVGYYHSHPDHPANWSDSDLAQALPEMAYVITAVHGPHGPEGNGENTRVVDTRAWRLRPDRSTMDHEPLVIEQPS